MCNLYSNTTGPAAIRDIADAMVDLGDTGIGNLAPLPAIFPDTMAPVVRHAPGGRALQMMRWGMPSPAFALKGRKTDGGVSNVRNTGSAHWRRWLGRSHRCLIPFNSFCEYDTRAGQGKTPVWFALSDERPLGFFAGIWTEWTSVRRLKDGETTDDLFGLLTCAPNAEVGEVHPKAMPVILRDKAQLDLWMEGETQEALTLQAPLPDGALRIVARGARFDGAAPVPPAAPTKAKAQKPPPSAQLDLF